MSYSERKKLLGVPDGKDYIPHDNERILQQIMKDGDDARRQRNWVWRVGSEAQWCCEQGWYPFFVTLTVDPFYHDPRSIWENSGPAGPWQKYLRRVCNIVTRSMGHRPIRKSMVPQREYLRYFGVIEHGKSREHHHMHALLFLRDVPPYWKRDPNKGRPAPQRTRTRCLPLENLWPYALPENKPAEYFRYCGDVWTKLGFVVPLKNGKAYDLAAPRTAGLYVGKYLGKDQKEWQHRVKATRMLGLNELIDLMERMPIEDLEALSWRPLNHNTATSLTMIHSVPLVLLRSLANRTLFCRLWATKELDMKHSLLRTSDAYSKMLKDVRSGLNPRKMSSEELYDWVGRHLPVANEYCDHQLLEAHQQLSNLFPPDDEKPITTIGANNYDATP